MAIVRIDVWSDIACPWCYVGKRRLETALNSAAARPAAEVTWHSFELDPAAPRVPTATGYAERLATKYGMSVDEARGRIEHMVGLARAEGLEFDFERIQPGNTFDAHRLLHWAHQQNLQDRLKERFFLAYFSEGAAISEPATLVRLAEELGLDGTSAKKILQSDDFATEVRADEALASQLQIHGVPFFVFDGRFAVSGAQPAEVLAGILEKCADASAAALEGQAEGAVCGPDGC